MNANDVKEGIYVRPVSGSKLFSPSLFQVVERTVGGRVELVDCVQELGPDEEPLHTTVMQVVQSMVLVEPAIPSGDDLLGELQAA